MPVTGAADTSPLRKRQRVRKACMPCRERKRKCDGNRPCATCVSYGYQCQYAGNKELESFSTKNLEKRLPEDQVTNAITESSVEKPITSAYRASPIGATTNIIDPGKSVVHHSSVSFPRTLGLELQSSNPPRLSSIGWNCGIRQEEKSNTRVVLSELITKQDCYRFSNVYFTVVHPIFYFVNREKLTNEIEVYWSANKKETDYGAVIAGIVALGSFFSGNLGHPQELDVVEYAKHLLEDPASNRIPSMEQVSAWILRTVYLRTAALPHLAWIASCTSLHLCEVIGLNHEIDKSELASNSNFPLETASDVCEYARRIFWCAWAINTIISYDYGRSRVVLTKVSCKSIEGSEDNHVAELMKLAHLIPHGVKDSSYEDQVRGLLTALAAVHNFQPSHPFLRLTKAELCLSFYRRLRLLNHAPDKNVVLQIIDIGRAALIAANDLVKKNQAWWLVLSTSFQYVCVLLAIDTPESLANVTSAMSSLDSIVSILGTSVAFEAQNTAKLLLLDSLKRKRQQIEQLGNATQVFSTTTDENFLNIDWDALWDPSYTVGFL